MYRHSKLNLNRTSVFGLRTYIQSYIEYYRNIMKNMLGSVNNTLFIPNAPQFRNLKETKISKKSGNSDGSSEEVEEWFDSRKCMNQTIP